MPGDKNINTQNSYADALDKFFQFCEQCAPEVLLVIFAQRVILEAPQQVSEKKLAELISQLPEEQQSLFREAASNMVSEPIPHDPSLSLSASDLPQASQTLGQDIRPEEIEAAQTLASLRIKFNHEKKKQNLEAHITKLKDRSTEVSVYLTGLLSHEECSASVPIITREQQTLTIKSPFFVLNRQWDQIANQANNAIKKVRHYSSRS